MINLRGGQWYLPNKLLLTEEGLWKPWRGWIVSISIKTTKINPIVTPYPSFPKDYNVLWSKVLLYYCKSVFEIIGKKLKSNKVERYREEKSANKVQLRVAKPIMDLVVNNTNSINILPNQTVEYKLDVNNYIGSTITETKIQFKFIIVLSIWLNFSTNMIFIKFLSNCIFRAKLHFYIL